MGAPFDDPSWDTFGLLKEAYLALDKRFAEVTEALVPIERAVLDLLIRVARSPGAVARPTDLAKGLSMVPSHITRCLDEAEARGLLERRPHPTDRRSTLVAMAPAGRSLLAEIEAPLRQAQKRLIHEHLGEQQVGALEDTLRCLRDHAQNDGARSDGARSEDTELGGSDKPA